MTNIATDIRQRSNNSIKPLEEGQGKGINMMDKERRKANVPRTLTPIRGISIDLCYGANQERKIGMDKKEKEIDEEKTKWLHEIGLVELGKPMKYICSMGAGSSARTMMYTEDYIKNTPLDELKKGYESNYSIKTFG